mgnify:CR=1 FL=1
MEKRFNKKLKQLQHILQPYLTLTVRSDVNVIKEYLIGSYRLMTCEGATTSVDCFNTSATHAIELQLLTKENAVVASQYSVTENDVGQHEEIPCNGYAMLHNLIKVCQKVAKKGLIND